MHNLRQGSNISNISKRLENLKIFVPNFLWEIWYFFLFIATGYRSFIHIIIPCAGVGPCPYLTQVPKSLLRPSAGIIPSPLGQEAGCHSAVPAALLRRPAEGKRGSIFPTGWQWKFLRGRSMVTSAVIQGETQDSLSQQKYARGCSISRNVQGICTTCWLWDTTVSPFPEKSSGDWFKVAISILGGSRKIKGQ